VTTSGGRVHDRAILDLLESQDLHQIEKDVWRVTRKGRDPLRGAVASGRWNAMGEFEVLYSSLAAEGALAEVGHRLSLEPIWPSRIRHEIHTLRVKADRALIFSDVQQLEKLGVNVAKFGGYEYVGTQAIAAAAHFLECETLIVPSARYSGSNLVMFLDRMQTQPELISTEPVDWDAGRSKLKR
jgi:RES domain-containing protein